MFEKQRFIIVKGETKEAETCLHKQRRSCQHMQLTDAQDLVPQTPDRNLNEHE